jgi:hypothetical protein
MNESANAAKTQLDSGRCMRNMCMWGEQREKGGYTRDGNQSFSVSMDATNHQLFPPNNNSPIFTSLSLYLVGVQGKEREGGRKTKEDKEF